MSTKWTKGSWRVSDARTGGEYWVVAGEGKGFGLIAEVPIEANAKLIAAAPALAEALEETRSWIDSESWNHNFNCDRVFEIIDAALASAKGEQ